MLRRALYNCCKYPSAAISVLFVGLVLLPSLVNALLPFTTLFPPSTNTASVAGNLFGNTLACRGTRLIIGEPARDDVSQPNLGRADLYDPSLPLSPPVAQVLPPTAIQGARFGALVSFVSSHASRGESQPGFVIAHESNASTSFLSTLFYFPYSGATTYTSPAATFSLAFQEAPVALTSLDGISGLGSDPVVVVSTRGLSSNALHFLQLFRSPQELTSLGVTGLIGFGIALAPIRDLDSSDGETSPDLLVGADTDGGAFVVKYNVTASGIVNQGDIAAPFGSNGFGSSVASVGDVNNGGRADILIGAPDMGLDTPGSAFLYLSETSTLVECPTSSASPTTENGSLFGYAAAGLGDTDGDGDKEFAIGAPGVTVAGNSSAGAVYIFSFDATLGACRLEKTLRGTSSGQEFGRALAGSRDPDTEVCDFFPGDGLLPNSGDLAIGTKDDGGGSALDQGSVELFSGITPTPTSTPTPTNTPTPSSTPTATASATETPTPTSTPAPSPTAVVTLTPSPSPSPRVPALPTAALLSFRLTRENGFTLKLKVNEAADNGCSATLYARTAVDQARDPITKISDFQIVGTEVVLTADNLPRVQKQRGIVPAVYMTVRLRCGSGVTSPPTIREIYSNVFGRYLNCGDISQKGPPSKWITALKRRLRKGGTRNR